MRAENVAEKPKTCLHLKGQFLKGQIEIQLNACSGSGGVVWHQR